MRLKSGFYSFAFTALVGAAIIVGCTADGGSADLGPAPSSEQNPTEDNGNVKLPPSSSGSSGDPGTPEKDSGKPDKPEAGKDSGTPPKPDPKPGDACTKADEIISGSCGKCGKHLAICEAATLKVSEYGECTGEVVDGCDPNDPDAGAGATESCGKCGTRTVTCSKYCAKTYSACKNEGPCLAGQVEESNAGCPANQYRTRTCESGCQWGNFSGCQAPPTSIEIPSVTSVGAIYSAPITLRASDLIPRVTGTCPNATVSASTLTPGSLFDVHNNSPKTVVASVYNSQAQGGPIIDTVIASYPGTGPEKPVKNQGSYDLNVLKACVKGVGDYGNAALVVDEEFASLDAGNAVTIAPGATVTIYSASYYTVSPGTPDQKMKLNVKIEQLN